MSNTPSPSILPVTTPASAAPAPGYKTSEFWLTISLHLLSVLIASGVFPDGSVWAKVAALLMSGLAQYSYNGSRAVVKSATTILLLLCLLPAACCLQGCSLLQSPTAGYVAADRATYDAIAPEYQTYVSADPNLGADAKARRERTVETWDLRIRQATPPAPATQPAASTGAAP